ncbi:hypothetical protein DYBT9275_00080 [Dyadobacter sp. CECT 9275]|uniref:3-keto-alpha-glucoside-1,2-lyase/3-keto-2-hydroxy-glucal hydratase domain-containing protein n=1 Tax=Dyadobacter helix TaxID=2822344 RepID=A0A916NA63_9BACT|nr:DUF1080 domain-containing protein [Dyadobacter sp. CECT 9275]CAG4988431.1 hypothetical protein DYBT9275_00080 [Dyadobacter sp. CECT 9275]
MKTTQAVLMISSLSLLLAFRLPAFEDTGEMRTDTYQTKKWETLFDGKNLDKWRKAAVDSAPSKGWIIENGTLSATKGRKGGDIITKETYSSFELQCEFKLTHAANSGIKYLVNSIQNANTKKYSPMGVEYQIIDDKNYPEVKNDPDGVSSTGAVYLLYAPKGKKLLPAGEWNKMRILVKGKHTEHWLNGVKVAEYERGSTDFNQKVATTKFKDYPDYAKADTGHIMLTDHGDQVFYKEIKIRRL